MSEKVNRFSYNLEEGVNQFTWQFAKHWLLIVNLLMAVFIGLPYLVPVLEYFGFNGLAHAIHLAYRVTCHQLPERSYFILGHQASICQRCSAIWLMFLIGGVIYAFSGRRIKPLPFKWWVLALIPVGLDGGTQLMGPIYAILPGWLLSGAAVLIWAALTIIMLTRKVRDWQYYLFVACLPAAMIFVQITGARLSNWELRSLTGGVFGLANAWLMYPMFQEAFGDLRQEMEKKANPAEPVEISEGAA